MGAPTLRVRIAPGILPGVEPGFLDWVDVTSYCKSASVQIGRSQDLERVEAGLATVVLENSDARFTPRNTSGPYYPHLRTVMHIEVSYISDGTLTPFTLGLAELGDASATLYLVPPTSAGVFRGLVERISPEHYVGGGGHVTMEAVDRFRYLVLQKVSGSFSAQTVGARIEAVLTAIGNPFPTVIDTGGVTIAAATLTKENALDYILGIVEQDGGVFLDRGNALTFLSLESLRAASTYRVVQVELGDDPGEIRARGFSRTYDEQFIYNEITGSTSGGTPITPQENTDSQEKYLVRNYDFGTTEITTVAELTQRALVQLVTHMRERERVDDLFFELNDLNTDSETLTALDINHRVQITRRPSAGSPIAGEFLVEGIRHDVTLEPYSWRLQFMVASAPSASFILGEAILGDTAVL